METSMYKLQTDSWYLERLLCFMAGIIAILSSLLAWLHSICWLILTILVGLNLFVFSTTGFCPSATFLRRMGAKARLETGSQGQRNG